MIPLDGICTKERGMVVGHVQDLPVRHVIDVMHVEKNVAETILKFLFGEKDDLACRRDMEEANCMHDLWLRQKGAQGNYFKPSSPYAFTPLEKDQFMTKIATIKTPTGYGASYGKHKDKDTLMGLKSHDYHCMIQQIIPVCVRGNIPPAQQTALIRLGKVFTRICAKVQVKGNLESLQQYVVETLCILEVCFPPALFDIMAHLVVHLVPEIALCGPVTGRWSYPLERYLAVLKGYVRNKARPEASMANGYMWMEVLGFCTEYLGTQPHINRRVWESEEDMKMSGEVVEGAARHKILSAVEVSRIHEYVVGHSNTTVTLRRYASLTHCTMYP